ncbi:MAG: primase C-terminal domain-containing protein, partial [Deltaproteobacteria bacterium]
MSIYDSKELIFQNNPLIEENFSCKNENQTTTINDNFQKTDKDYELYLHHADPYVSLTIGDICEREYQDDIWESKYQDDIWETEYKSVSFFTPTKDKPFSNEIDKFVSIIFEPNDVIEIRLIHSDKENKLRKRYFCLAKDLSSRANSIKTSNSEEYGLNVYVSINPRISLYGGGKAKDVLFARCMFVDFDNLTIDEALKRLIEVKLPRPTLIVSSGKGFHFYWKLLERVTDLILWSEIQQQFIFALKSDPCINDAPRVMRLSGFQNMKHQEAPLCYIYEENRDFLYNLQDLIDCLSAISEPLVSNKKEHKASSCENKTSLIPFTGEKYQRAKAYSNQFLAVDINRNDAYFKKSCDLFKKFNISEEKTFFLLSQVNEKQNDPLDAEELRGVVINANKYLNDKGVARGFDKVEIRQEYIEKFESEITLSEARSQMVDCRIKSLSEKGVFFDGSVPGTGKSTADIQAIKKSRTSLTVLPTHDACKELVDRFSKEGISATAYPKLSAVTCKKYGTIDQPGLAQKIQASGLNVATSLCERCEFNSDCIYQKERQKARNSKHTIATHARTEATDFSLFKDKEIVFVHENPLSLLRPCVEVENIKHFEDLLSICKYARKVAIRLNDPSAIEILNIFESGIEDLIDILADDQFFKEYESSSQNDRKNLAKIKCLPCREKSSFHDRVEYILYRAMIDYKKYSNQNALHLAIGYSFGNLKSLFAKVEENRVGGGQINVRNFLVGFWQTELPNQLIWFEDGSSDVKMLQDLTGLNVIDQTPIGKIKNHIEPIQFTQKDVTQQTTPEIIKSIVRGFLAKYNHCKNVGIICHKCHVPEIKSLSSYWENRIRKVSYFFSGDDRASNDWLNCDLLIVLGTPRVPPSAVRNLL